MKTTRWFQIAQTADGGLFYELAVDGVPVGRDDFLGVEQNFAPNGAPTAILDLIVRQGVQRTTATAFLWSFLEEKKKRQVEGGAPFKLEELLECDE